MDFENDPLLDFPVQDSTYTFQPQMPVGVFYSQEVISMGLQEPLPPDLMIEDLYVSHRFISTETDEELDISYTSKNSTRYVQDPFVMLEKEMLIGVDDAIDT